MASVGALLSQHYGAEEPYLPEEIEDACETLNVTGDLRDFALDIFADLEKLEEARVKFGVRESYEDFLKRTTAKALKGSVKGGEDHAESATQSLGFRATGRAEGPGGCGGDHGGDGGSGD